MASLFPLSLTVFVYLLKTCPIHFNLVSLNSFFILPICTAPHIHLLFILSIRVTPIEKLSIFNFSAPSLLLVLFVYLSTMLALALSRVDPKYLNFVNLVNYKPCNRTVFTAIFIFVYVQIYCLAPADFIPLVSNTSPQL